MGGSLTPAKTSPAFRKGIASIAKGDKLIAPIRAYLYNPDFQAFTVEVKGIGNRAPDYHFHPSEHPSWNDRSLYIWMTEPDLLLKEPQEPTAVLAMTAGSIWHSIIGRVLVDLGLVDQLEVFVEDKVRRTRGSMDWVAGSEVGELKTMKDQILGRINSVEDYLQRYPGYHLQANEYMRMSGLRSERVLLMALTFPYEMREFVIPYDMALGFAQEQKYERVLQAVADGRMPMCNGCVGKDRAKCPARGVCAVELRR